MRKHAKALLCALCVLASGACEDQTQGEGAAPGDSGVRELYALVRCDHISPALIEPFENDYGVKVSLQKYDSAGAASAVLKRAQPGDWDVIVIDGVDVPDAVDTGLLTELPQSQLPLDDMFKAVLTPNLTSRSGRMYAVTEKFGYNAVSYNKKRVDPADMRDLKTLWSGKYKKRIALYGERTALMNLTALKMGLKPADITAEILPALKQELFALKDNALMTGGAVSAPAALADGRADILIGGGEWAVAGLASVQPELAWTPPDQGGVLWTQTLAVPASSKNKDLAFEFVKYLISPEAQARLATSSCFWGMPTNKMAAEYLTEQEKAALRWDEQPAFMAAAHNYTAPNPELDAKMREVWTEFLRR